ncbi:hypothetical protein K435DRAFT_777985 [Dendrothele bispora CBS 962.96]|uniref:F-box domain-containing protein n=1 Tax=Dendrothele bispora (strain CBS 962.96) TaxID=1314807 RepID=A0A4S8M5N2_DENBC|nr:hypothetical protein K435DRAFT_777985 [Dendrothele bispora CBS 962.96]
MPVFEASEIVEQILRWCDKSTINDCARVSKQWSEIALDLRWHKITNLEILLGPLGIETRRRSRGWNNGRSTIVFTYELVSQPTNEGWMRFEKHYAHRVRVLRLEGVYDQNLLDVLYRIRSSKPLLPNLKTIYCSRLLGKGLMEPLFLFVHEDILEFMLDVPEPYSDATRTVLGAIYRRMPNLEKLNITIWPDSRYVSSINEVVRNLPSLKFVTIPATASDGLVVLLSILISLPKLRILHIIPGRHQLDVPGESDAKVPIFPMGCFQTLETLVLCSEYSTASSMLCCTTFPRLENLEIYTGSLESRSGLQSLLSNIQKNCHSLVKLSLGIESLAQSRISQEISSLSVQTHLHHLYCITLADLSPILSITPLLSFEILCPFCLELGLDDLEQIASAWPKLKSLNLNAFLLDTTLFPEVQRLDLRSILPFARHCPDIEELGIFLDAESRSVPSESDIDALPSHFTKLKTLFFGKSSISDEGEVAQFLSCVCPIGCAIGYGKERYVCEGDDEMARKWRVVGDFLPRLFAVRRRYEQKLALEKKRWMSIKDVCT